MLTFDNKMKRRVAHRPGKPGAMDHKMLPPEREKCEKSERGRKEDQERFQKKWKKMKARKYGEKIELEGVGGGGKKR